MAGKVLMAGKMQLLLAAVAFLVVAGAPSQAIAQEEGGMAFQVDEQLAKKGKKLWSSKACYTCHTIGKGKLAGPDLAGVTDRRSIEWLRKWLADTTGMLQSDPVAQQLLEEYHGIKMPDMKLKDNEVEALIHYMAKESE